MTAPPLNRAQRRAAGHRKPKVLREQAAIQAMMREIDRLQADPRPWRIHQSEQRSDQAR